MPQSESAVRLFAPSLPRHLTPCVSGTHFMSAPPPLPPGPPHSDQMADAFAQRQSAPPPAPVPKQGMPGCSIAAIIGALAVVVCLLLAGIYAVNAVRDEQQAQVASTRTKISNGLAGLGRLKATVDDYVFRNRACPSNLALKMPKDATFAFGDDGSLPASLRLGALSNGHCVIETALCQPRTVGRRHSRVGIDRKRLDVLRRDFGRQTSPGTMPFLRTCSLTDSAP